jgi:PleD family two-component response regulator
MEEARRERPAFVVADLHAQKCDPFELALKLKADEQLSGVPLLGFFSHVRVELQQKAKESGFDRVLTRSAFTKQLPEILQSADDPGA